MKNVFALSHIGSRERMEDRVVLIKDFRDNPDWIFGGVFDGHGGSEVADLASKCVPKIFLDNSIQGFSASESFQKTYKQFSEMAIESHIGSTGLSFFLQGDILHVANIGDCRLIVINGDQIDQVTIDHTVKENKELKRLEKYNARVHDCYIMKDYSGVGVTRAFGDLFFKDSGIISEPDIFEVKLSKDSVVIAGSDGVWGVMENKEISALTMFESAEDIARNILFGILKKPKKFFDNISIIVLKM